MASWPGLRTLRSVLRPEAYHGHPDPARQRRPFFEGWYFKLVDAAQAHPLAVIPGVFFGTEPGSAHAFVQVLDGATGAAAYHRFPLEAFRASAEALDVRVGGCRFHRGGLELALRDEAGPLSGSVRFEGTVPWPVTWRAPGVMGWYAWVPTMECYHGVVSLDHGLAGALRRGEELLGFDGGRGYAEKDWGQAFPAAYVWMQTNHFGAPGTSLTASAALIPWRRSRFRGFLAGLWHGGRLFRFATWTGARIERIALDDTYVELVLRDRRLRLALRATRATGGLLHSPIRTEMHRRVDETLRATVDVRLSSLSGGTTVFEGRGTSAGLEVHGDLPALLADP